MRNLRLKIPITGKFEGKIKIFITLPKICNYVSQYCLKLVAFVGKL